MKEHEAAQRAREESQAKGSLTSRARMEEDRAQMRINKEVRSCGRVDDKRFKTVTDRGYDIDHFLVVPSETQSCASNWSAL